LQLQYASQLCVSSFIYRLRAKGLKFSDVPTEEETTAAEKEYLLKKDLDGIDPTLIINTSRGSKRPADGPPSSSSAGTGVAPPPKQIRVDISSGGVVVKQEGVQVKVESATAAAVTATVSSGADSGGGEAASAGVVTRVKTEYSDEEAEF
jgi:hypothetical protein